VHPTRPSSHKLRLHGRALTSLRPWEERGTDTSQVNLKFVTQSVLGFVADAFDGSQKSGGPLEGLRVCVVQVDEGADVGLEPPDGGMDTPLDLLSDEFSEPALDLIDP
jgi:hypothetical protein